MFVLERRWELLRRLRLKWSSPAARLFALTAWRLFQVVQKSVSLQRFGPCLVLLDDEVSWSPAWCQCRSRFCSVCGLLRDPGRRVLLRLNMCSISKFCKKKNMDGDSMFHGTAPASHGQFGFKTQLTCVVTYCNMQCVYLLGTVLGLVVNGSILFFRKPTRD